MEIYQDGKTKKYENGPLGAILKCRILINGVF